jgi:hypothetical protein
MTGTPAPDAARLADIKARLATQSYTAWFRDAVTTTPGEVIENVVEHDWNVASFHGGSTSNKQERQARATQDADFFLRAPEDMRFLIAQHDADTRRLSSIAAVISERTDILSAEVHTILDGRIPRSTVAGQNLKAGAEAIHDLLTMLGVDPDEVSNPAIDLRTIAETLAHAVLKAAR